MTSRTRLLLVFAVAMWSPAAGAQAQGLVPICHATGDPAHPYDTLSVPPGQLDEHLDHEGDLIPAPSSGCPAVDEPDPTPSAEPDSTAYAIPTPTPSGSPYYGLPTPTPTVAGDTEDEDDSGNKDDVENAGVLADDTGGGSGAAPASVDGLPLTGGAPGLVGLAGFGLLLAGLGLALRLRAGSGRAGA